MRVVDPVARAVVDPQLGDATADRLHVAGIPCDEWIESDLYPFAARRTLRFLSDLSKTLVLTTFIDVNCSSHLGDCQRH